MKEMITLYKKVYNGKPWYGKNIMETLDAVPISKVCQRFGSSYNIGELVHHMIAWRTYTIHVLKHNQHYEVNQEENFPKIDSMSLAAWRDLLETFEASQKEMQEAISQFDRSWEDAIPDKGYDHKDLIFGVIHHDVYHIGQINFMAKFLFENSEHEVPQTDT
ncbi:MAG: DinB family protein [Saprospiraceae bacterium]|nr:DinB family protein [Saprospiraceae bacterium]